MFNEFKDFIMDTAEDIEDFLKEDSTASKIAKTTIAGTTGGVAGGVAVAASGLTAIGAVGGGAGIGAAAGPVGIAAGAVVGLATYGVYKLFKK